MSFRKVVAISDKIQILRHITLYRFWNIIVLWVTYIVSKISKKNFHHGLPFSLSIEPTTACNLGCPECPSGLKEFTRATGKLKLDTHQTMLKQLSKSVFYINYYFQGEPFLHPQFLDLIKEAKKHSIYTSTSTNAHFISKEKAVEIVNSRLDRLIISIDGTAEETYENYRVNGKLKKVLEATEYLIDAKKSLIQKRHISFFNF